MQKTGTKPTPTAAIERHFTVPELSKLLNLNPCAVRRMFPDEPIAVRIRTAPQPGRRSNSTYRIPALTALRVHRRPAGVGSNDATPAGGNRLPNVPAPEVAA
jgi:hypothetical protein